MDLVYGSPWRAVTKLNCHHLAERLSREQPVLYVESVGARVPRLGEWRRAVPRLMRSMRPLRRVGPQLWLYSPLPLPLYRASGARLNSRWVGWQVRTLLALRGWLPDVCWVFHPMGWGTARAVCPRGLIYYCVDDQAANPGVDPRAIRALESDLAGIADVVIATGEPIAAQLRGLARRVEVLPNVADTELFLGGNGAVRHPVLDRIGRTPRPRIGYLGNLAAYKIDIDLIYAVARARRDWTIVLVGPRNQGDSREVIREEAAPGNVHFTGPIPHQFAPAVIDLFDVCLLPAAHHDVMLASFPLKFFEYLLRGRPVVARPLPSLQPFRGWFDEAAGLSAWRDCGRCATRFFNPARLNQ